MNSGDTTRGSDYTVNAFKNTDKNHTQFIPAVSLPCELDSEPEKGATGRLYRSLRYHPDQIAFDALDFLHEA